MAETGTTAQNRVRRPPAAKQQRLASRAAWRGRIATSSPGEKENPGLGRGFQGDHAHRLVAY
jgi:hypothetical protein